jgi:hypothetical protein
MPIESPNLDDRTFHELLLEAKAHVTRACPGWTDQSVHEPGTILLEAFAYMTDVMLYRLNRLPEKAYVELLRLIGVELQPPTAAVARLELRLARAATAEVEIPRGLRVTAGGGGEAPVFTVAHRATIPTGEQGAEVLAYHAEWVEAEPVGRSNGTPGQTVRVQRRPIVARTSEDLEVFVGVEIRDGEDGGRVPSMVIDGRRFRLWREVESFADQGPDAHVFLVDRVDGTIQFPPAVRRMEPHTQQDGDRDADPGGERLSAVARPLGAVPPAGRDMVVSYWCGGGAAGNVRADALTTLKDGLPGGGATVRNPAPARGGRDGETVDNALRRGPLELFTLERAVTSGDYEALARRNGGVARARAFTRSELWAHAEPGSVEVVLVPRLDAPERATLEGLQEAHSREVLQQVQAALDERRPAGTSCAVTWARYKRVRVRGDVVVHRAERTPELRERIARRLHGTINPLPVPSGGDGWRFGQALKASHAYDAILAEPGVVYAERIRFVVDEVPDSAVRSIARDVAQRGTWYAGSGSRLFRSQNDAESWELVHDSGEGQVEAVASPPATDQAGRVAMACNVNDEGAPQARILLSRDGGETWAPRATLERHRAHDMAWTSLERAPVLLVATDRGLYRIFVDGEAGPDLVVVDPDRHDRGVASVAVGETARQERLVAVAVSGVGGVFLSEPGVDHFRAVGLEDEDVRVVRLQYDGLRTFLWAGVSAIGDTPGTGCHVMELVADEKARSWTRFGAGWVGGTCHDLTFQGTIVHAATHRAGVLSIDSRRGGQGTWSATDVNAGLPLEVHRGRVFHPVRAVASTGRPQRPDDRPILLAGGPQGVFRSVDGGQAFESRADREFTESVTLPETWLFCSGDHDLRVRTEGGTP